MPEPAKNPILAWSWDKPTEEGLYLACLGDVETENNIYPLRLVKRKAGQDPIIHEWPCYSHEELGCWSDSFKFAKLCTGSEVQKISDD